MYHKFSSANVCNNHCLFFFNDTATTEIYTLSLHGALPISRAGARSGARRSATAAGRRRDAASGARSAQARRHPRTGRSEEHTSELQSRQYLVCRLLLEKKRKHAHILHFSLIVPIKHVCLFL